MINQISPASPDDRLNGILDKISRDGIKSLKKDELRFLRSYSTGTEIAVNNKLSSEESRKTFLSDDGLFCFKLRNIESFDDIKYINGIILVPDIIRGRKTVKGELKGSIISFVDGSVAIDFHRGKWDVFEFVEGLEYELDCFIDDIITKLKEIE